MNAVEERAKNALNKAIEGFTYDELEEFLYQMYADDCEKLGESGKPLSGDNLNERITLFGYKLYRAGFFHGLHFGAETVAEKGAVHNG